MKSASFWTRLGHWILDHPVPLVGIVIAATVFLGYWATQVRTDHTAGQFLSSDSQEARDYQRAGQVFGQSQAILYLAFRNVDPYDPRFLAELDAAVEEVRTYQGVESVLALTNVPYLIRDGSGIASRRLHDPESSRAENQRRLDNQPFLKGLLLSRDGTAPAMTVSIDPVFNNRPERVDLVNRIQQRADQLPGEVALAGFPYLRTRYAERVTAEAPLFAALALAISLLMLYLAFRDWRAVLLPAIVVALGIAWTVGLIALFDHRLNIVTSILPALFVIIGMATTVHLCTAYYDRYGVLNDRRQALIETIGTVGISTFLACLTTAIGFAVLVLSGSRLLSAFGQFAAIGIMLMYALALVLIPLFYTHLRPPSREASALITHDRVSDLFGRLGAAARRYRIWILIAAGVASVAGIVGATRISTDLYVFSDFHSSDPLRQDLAFFEEKFGGVLPMEVVVEADRPGVFRSLANMRRIDQLEESLDSLPYVSRSLSATDLVKLANQAYFGGNPATYRLPSSYELPFLQAALESFLRDREGNAAIQNLPLFVDSTFTITRVFLGVSDIGTERMNHLVETARAKAASLFPDDEYNVFVTGTAVTSTRSGETLVRNLILSLAAALLLISVLMAVLFKSARLTMISLVPNVIPLLVVAGAMGYWGIPLKPSTALIFSLAFGIAVDASIHFLAKFRHLLQKGVREDAAILVTMHETGKAIFVNSLVLIGGFLVFTLSSFGGTVSMGALTALTLGIAMTANLLVLPALLFGQDLSSIRAKPSS